MSGQVRTPAGRRPPSRRSDTALRVVHGAWRRSCQRLDVRAPAVEPSSPNQRLGTSLCESYNGNAAVSPTVRLGGARATVAAFIRR